jgi:UDP-GlcNAc3NAcA epimerase
VKIVTVVGARPQFVKAAVVSREIAKRAAAGVPLSELIVHTGQHFDENMSDVFFDEMAIPRPHVLLQFGGLSHGAMTGRMIEALESIVLAERPDWLVIYGDTNSTLAGALAAVKVHTKVAHVEAGLRSFNRAMPEEINRVVADHVSDLLFAPTDEAVANLATEGIAGTHVVRTGDVMCDASLFYAEQSKGRPLPAGIVHGEKFVLCTIHRAENTDDATRLAAIAEALCALSSQVRVVLPLHPRTKNAFQKAGLLERVSAAVTLLPPLGYLDMVALEAASTLVLTDSGGVQKEAYVFGKQCVTLRTETEWVELVRAGVNVLVPPFNASAIVDAVSTRLCMPFGAKPGIYGNGDAATAIVDSLLQATRH